MDIWVKPIRGGRAAQVTTHPTDDLYPCWSADGKKIIFVSQREDAAGDLWQITVDIENNTFPLIGKPQKLTTYLGLDDSPTISPDGMTIAFTSDRAGQRNIWLYNLRKKKERQLTFNGGMNPTWCPDGKQIAFISFRNGRSSNGDMFIINVAEDRINADDRLADQEAYAITSGPDADASPSWHPQKNKIVFTRYSQDSNGDGHINLNDQSSLWEISLDERRELQLTPGGSYDILPFYAQDDHIFYTNTKSGNHDIWSIKDDSPIPRQENAFLQYQFADLYFFLAEDLFIFEDAGTVVDEEFLDLRLIAFQRVIDFFPADSAWIVATEYELARTFFALNEVKFAKERYHAILSNHPAATEIIGKIHWNLLRDDLRQHRDDIDYIQKKIAYCQQLKSNYVDIAALAAKFDLTIAELYEFVDDEIQALRSYQNVINLYPQEREYCAIAEFRKAEIYSAIGEDEDATSSFLTIIENYPDQEQWVNLALDRILEVANKSDLYSTIAVYRKIIEMYRDYQRLAARTQFNMGKLLFANEQYEKAINELSLVEQNYPEQKKEIATAELLIADAYLKNNEELRAINLLKEIVDKYGSVAGGLYVVMAKERLLEIYLNSGRRLRNSGDFQLAFQRYQGAIKIQSRNLEAHRGAIFALYQLGRIDDAIRIYSQKLQQYPDDEVAKYILGLCYSYKATEESERKNDLALLDYLLLKKSNETIEEALTQDYGLIPAYLTLSYNYEVIEKYESFQRSKPKGFFRRFGETVSAPVVAIFRFITLQKEKPPERWFEKAIDALTTALALNDESADPILESELALNLAHNYYNLEEFGYEKAYFYYNQKLKYDSTFISLPVKANVYSRMGHCAYVIEDFRQGPKHLLQAIKLHHDLGNKGQELLNIKRLALLYQSAGEYDQSITYLRQAADSEEKSQRWNDLQKTHRNIAYNYQLLNDEEEALRYASKAATLIYSGRVDKIEAKPNWVKIGILGIEIPILDIGFIGAGESTAIEGFTTGEERALLYSIMADAFFKQKNYPRVIEYYHKKLEIYRKRKDKVSEAIFLNNIGYLYYLNEQFQQAWKSFEISYQICKAEDLIAGMLSNVINLGALSVLQSKLHHDDDLSKSFQYLQAGTELYAKEEIGFLKEKVQIHALIGNLHYLKKSTSSDSLATQGYSQQIIDFQQRLENLLAAETNYLMGIEIAEKYHYQMEQIYLYQNLGQVYYEVGEESQALSYFQQSRKLAIENNYSNLLWRSDFALANIIAAMDEAQWHLYKITNDAGFFYSEAIAILNETIFSEGSFHYTRLYAQDIRALFEDAIRYYIKKEPTTALVLTEKLRSKEYLDVFSSHKILLKKERHKNYLGLARDDVRRIAELDEKLRLAKFNPQTEEKQINEWQELRQKYLTDQQELLDKMNAEEPELQSMVRINPVSLSDFQYTLTDNGAALAYLSTADSTYVWFIDETSISLTTLAIGRIQINNIVQNIFSNLPAKVEDSSALHELYDAILAPLAGQWSDFQNIIIIPDGQLCFVPFNTMINYFHPAPQTPRTVVVTPSISSYYFSFQKRKISGEHILVVNDQRLSEDLDNLGYSESTFTSDNNEKMKYDLENSDIIHLNARMAWHPSDPLLSAIEITNLNTISEKSVYAFDLNSNLIVIHGGILNDQQESINFISFNRALFYAGTPAILYNLWPVDTSAAEKFYHHFYEYLMDNPPGKALSLAQRAMQRDSIPIAGWAGYQLVGFQGMTESEEKQFAMQQFERRVRLGNLSYEEQDWDEAIKDYEQALNMAAKLNADRYINRLQQLIIQTAVKGENYPKAIAYQKELLAAAEADQDLQRMCENLNYLVLFSDRNGDFDDAIAYQKDYLKIVTQLSLNSEIASSYHRLGVLYEKAERFSDAIESYQKSLEEYDKQGNKLGIATNLKDRARIYFTQLDKYTPAIDDQQQALQLFQREGDDLSAVEVLQNIGLSYENLADYQTAMEYQQRALVLSQEIEDDRYVALSHQYLANLKWKSGEYQQALSFQNIALTKFQKQGDRKLQLIAYSTQGLIQMSLGQITDGLESEQQALLLANELQDKKNQATVHKNIGMLYLAQNQFQFAFAEFEKALQIDQQLNYKRGLAYDYRNLGSLTITLQQPDSALVYLHRALNLSQEIKDSRNVAQCYYEIGRARLLLNDTDGALDSLNLASEKAKFLLIPDIEWRALRMQAQIYEQKNMSAPAEEQYRKAIAVIEEMRAKIKVEEFKAGFIDDKLDVYSDLILLLLRTKQAETAFEVVERAKSRNFLDMLANREISFGNQASQSLVTEGQRIQNQIAKTQTEIANFRAKQEQLIAVELEQLQNLEQQLAQLKQAYADYLIRLKTENSELADIISVKPSSFQEIQASIPDSCAYVEYYNTKTQLITWAITKNKIKFAITDLPDSMLSVLVKDFRDAMNKQLSIQTIASQLNEILVAPVAGYLENIKHLVIIPHRILHYLPFAALMDKEGKYLIEKYTLSLAPSATVLNVCFEKGAKYQAETPWERSILALGNPDLGNPDLSLPFARKEIESIALTYPHLTSYLEKEATETTFREKCHHANIILFSCHGEFDAANPLFSALLLAKDGTNDGRLEAHEIFGIQLDAYLIAMSACETGLGTIRSGDEVIGLIRSFIYAGSSSILSSLWKVDDLATAVLIKRFFRNLKTPDYTRAQALRKAQLLIKEEVSSHPVFWAAFNISGDFR